MALEPANPVCSVHNSKKGTRGWLAEKASASPIIIPTKVNRCIQLLSRGIPAAVQAAWLADGFGTISEKLGHGVARLHLSARALLVN